MGKNQDPGSRMNNPDHISESLVDYNDPGSKTLGSGIRDGKKFRIRNTGINRRNTIRLGGTCVVFCWLRIPGESTEEIW
jgi:hypothetical protein